MTQQDIAYREWLARGENHELGKFGVTPVAFGAGYAAALAQAAVSAAVGAHAPSAWQRTVELRAAQGWKGLDKGPVPILYTDTINDDQVCRDDVWIAKTEHLKPAAAPAEPVARFTQYERNILEGVSNWLKARSYAEWARKGGHEVLMRVWSKDLADMLSAQSFIHGAILDACADADEFGNGSLSTDRVRGLLAAAPQAEPKGQG